MVMTEALIYISGWQQGNNTMAYVLRAAFLWQSGKHYTTNAELPCPLCWESQ